MNSNNNNNQMNDNLLIDNELIEWSENVVNIIDSKQCEIERHHHNSEKKTNKELNTLNKEDALLTQKQTQLTALQSKVDALEEGKKCTPSLYYKLFVFY